MKLGVFSELSGKKTGMRVLGRLSSRRGDNIEIDIKERNRRNWIRSFQDTDYWRSLLNVALNLRIP